MDVVLDLQSQRLTSAQLDARLLNVSNPLALRRLYLSNNELTEIPSSISRFQNLVLLYAPGNRLEHVCSELFQISSLQTLYLSCNSLSYVPAAIGQLTNLRGLSLHTNRIDVLPSTLSLLVQLDVLYLNNNPLPPFLNVNCYGNALETALLLKGACEFFKRLDPCRNAVWWTILSLGRVLPAELAQMIGRWVWTTRNDEGWALLVAITKDELRNEEDDEPHERETKRVRE